MQLTTHLPHSGLATHVVLELLGCNRRVRTAKGTMLWTEGGGGACTKRLVRPADLRRCWFNIMAVHGVIRRRAGQGAMPLESTGSPTKKVFDDPTNGERAPSVSQT